MKQEKISKLKNKTKFIPTIITLFPMIWGLALWKLLPYNMALSFDEYGRVQDTIPKTIVIFVFPILFAVVTYLCIYLLEHSKDKRRRSRVLEMFAWWGMPIFAHIFIPLLYYTALGYDIEIERTIFMTVGILFILIGNHFYKCRQNETTGIILPWTVRDPDNWNYTNRVAGIVFIIGGVLYVGNSLLEDPIITFSVLILIGFVPTLCSYNFEKKKKNKKS